MISIHALVKRATLDNVFFVVDLSNFNPRPREEGDDTAFCRVQKTARISIHALVKRATSIDYDMPTIYCISIHALVKRATRCFNIRPHLFGFQSTPS